MMKKVSWMCAALVGVLALGGVAHAQPIQPKGEKIATDPQGRPIYQVEANGIKIAYKLIGTGEPLVMIVGRGRTMERWPQAVLEGLSKNNQLIVLDNRGMGHSTVTDEPFTYKMFAADVVGLMDALGLEKSNVLGYSMGSTITQQLLLEYPQRVKKAILYATTTDGSNVPRGTPPEDPIVARQIDVSMTWKTPLDKLPLITNQVMVMIGTADEMVGTEGAKTIAAAIPGAWLVQFKGGHHGMMDEVTAEWTTMVATFLQMNQTVPAKSSP